MSLDLMISFCLMVEKGTSRQRSGKGAIRKGFLLQKPRREKKNNKVLTCIP